MEGSLAHVIGHLVLGTSALAEYHYHSEPGMGCAYTDTAGKHSPLYGIMLDSIPIYGAYGDNGVAPADLDECGGHTDATYSFYHYHVTANLAPPYVIRCFRGCVFNANGNPSVSCRRNSGCPEPLTLFRSCTQLLVPSTACV